MSLVIVHCGKCNKRLGSLDEMPTDWSGNLTVIRCRKCVIPSPRRLPKVLDRQKATGFALTVEIPLAQLRSPALKAARERRAEWFPLPPLYAAD